MNEQNSEHSKPIALDCALGTSKDPKPTKIWLNTICGSLEIRLEFDNDRHHAVMLEKPHNAKHLAHALVNLANNIMKDPHLKHQ